ncbi:hypothetical protein RHS01_05096 [Rhizoctonia solani]|uniref:Uncharacterized protein n=1 Tax=Rhizoctonia solani TaxID=456999 RepID=A0A8H7IBC1_9AGAM|nr:hypothetical protein RHS01_05096 [Rhizoctonia solani]
MYNHIRTVAWWLDALPFLTNAGLPFKVGVDDIISAFPVWGDIVGTVLSLYQIVNVVIDLFIGIVPFFGDALDVLFKANLRNLDLLEDWLLKDAPYRIALMPNREFLPRKRPLEYPKMTHETNVNLSTLLTMRPNPSASADRNRSKTTRMDDRYAPPDLD